MCSVQMCPSAVELDQLMLRVSSHLQGSREGLGVTAVDIQLPRGLRVDCLMLLQGERPGGSVGLDCDQGGLCQEGFPEEGPCAGIWRGWEKGEGGTHLGDLPQCPPRLAEVPAPSALPLPESPA